MRLTLEQWRARSCAVDCMRWLCASPSWLQKMWFGADYKRAVAFLRYLVFRHDCQVACRDLPIMLPAPESSVVALLPAPRSEDDARADFAPPWELLVEMQVLYGQYDIDSLDPMDAVDFHRDLDWCQDWLAWYSRHG